MTADENFDGFQTSLIHVVSVPMIILLITLGAIENGPFIGDFPKRISVHGFSGLPCLMKPEGPSTISIDYP